MGLLPFSEHTVPSQYNEGFALLLESRPRTDAQSK